MESLALPRNPPLTRPKKITDGLVGLQTPVRETSAIPPRIWSLLDSLLCIKWCCKTIRRNTIVSDQWHHVHGFFPAPAKTQNAVPKRLTTSYASSVVGRGVGRHEEMLAKAILSQRESYRFHKKCSSYKSKATTGRSTRSTSKMECSINSTRSPSFSGAKHSKIPWITWITWPWTGKRPSPWTTEPHCNCRHDCGDSTCDLPQL